jgi:hypothetical protein
MTHPPRLSRRTLLRAGALTLSLPLLEAMLPRGTRGLAYASEGAAPPTRLLFYYVPNGIHMPSWTPTTTGADFALPPILTPLARHRDAITLVSGLANRNAIDVVPGDHARGTAAFLTARLPRRTEGSDLYNGTSVDQVAARHHAGSTPFPSLQLGMEGGVSTGSCDSGYSCAYTRNISWADERTPLPKVINPMVAFRQLFGALPGGRSPEELEARQRRRSTVLDLVHQDAVALHGRLGASDRRKLDQYLTGIRELEARILDRTDRTCSPGETPEAFNQDLPVWSDTMNRIMAMALACDQTRFITFMFGNGASYRAFDFLGVTGAHHEISHHQNNAANFQRLETINTFEIDQFASLLDRLRAIEEPDGSTLLDHTALMFSSEIEDGNSHRHTNLPVLLAGRAGGAMAPGRHLRTAEERPIADLFLTLLQAADVPATSFGADGTRPLTELAGT